MTDTQDNFREVKRFSNRVLNRGFAGMELYTGTNRDNSKLIYDCYEKDEGAYSVGDYLGSVIFDSDREDAYQNEDLDPVNKVKDDVLGLLSRPTK